MSEVQNRSDFTVLLARCRGQMTTNEKKLSEKMRSNHQPILDSSININTVISAAVLLHLRTQVKCGVDEHQTLNITR